MRKNPVLLLLTLSCVLHATGFPEAEITNGLIKAKLYLPDSEKGYYRATRFDWSGVIASLEYSGHNYFGVWFPKYDPKLHDSITGPVEEFRTGLSALGYEDAKPGGTFIRIGVGVLRKPVEPGFGQFNTYEIVDPGKWTVHSTADSVEFVHEVGDPTSGYAYRYRKTVRLSKDKPQMVIEHTLENTGRRPIVTNVYSHNFYVIDGQPSGPDVTLKFKFNVKTARDVSGLAVAQGRELHYLRPVKPEGESLFSELEGYGPTADDFDIRVENKKAGAGVRLTGDQPLWKLVLWSISTVVCPEPFIIMNIEPGQKSLWRLTYDFYSVASTKRSTGSE